MRRSLLKIGLFAWCVNLFAPGFLTAGGPLETTLKPETIRAWLEYQRLTEKRITSELDSERGFLVQDFLPAADEARCRQILASGGVFVRRMEALTEAGKPFDVPGGLIHHWFGSVVVPKANLPDLLKWLQDYNHLSKYFEDVEDSRLISRQGETFKLFLRLKRKKIIAVHYNTEHTVEYRHRDDHRESSKSYATRIAELEDPGSRGERERPVGDDSGYLWRLNSYWRFQQLKTGVAVNLESMSLSRTIPFGLEWLVKGFVESVPRESLVRTLTSIRDRFDGRTKR